MTTYVELSYLLPSSLADQAVVELDARKPWIFATGSTGVGVTVLIPGVNHKGAEAVNEAQYQAEKFLSDLLPEGDAPPEPWRILLVDNDYTLTQADSFLSGVTR